MFLNIPKLFHFNYHFSISNTFIGTINFRTISKLLCAISYLNISMSLVILCSTCVTYITISLTVVCLFSAQSSHTTSSTSTTVIYTTSSISTSCHLSFSRQFRTSLHNDSPPPSLPVVSILSTFNRGPASLYVELVGL